MRCTAYKLFAVLLSSFSGSTLAADFDFTAFTGGEFWDSSSTPGHGIVSLRTDVSELFGGSSGFIEFNTDTIRLSIYDIDVGTGAVLGASFTGEAGIGNLLTDYFYDGDNDPSRGFFTSYVKGDVWVKFNPVNRLFISLSGSGRQWFFDPTEATNPDLVLPNQSFAFEPELLFTWWALSGDSAWYQPHRLFPRLSGVAAGAGVKGVLLSDANTWGYLSNQPSIERTNSPSSSMILINQWLLAGREISHNARVELNERGSMMLGEDDLYRAVIGGMSPYSVNLPGVPWGYYHGDDFVAASGRIAHRPFPEVDMEWGPVFGAIYLKDASRDGVDEFSAQYGYGLYTDLRSGQWQYELRGGFSPSLDAQYDNQDAWSLYFLWGWSTL